MILLTHYLGWASLVAQTVKNLLAMRENCVDPWDGKIPWRKEQLLIPVFLCKHQLGSFGCTFYFFFPFEMAESWHLCTSLMQCC